MKSRKGEEPDERDERERMKRIVERLVRTKMKKNKKNLPFCFLYLEIAEMEAAPKDKGRTGLVVKVKG